MPSSMQLERRALLRKEKALLRESEQKEFARAAEEKAKKHQAYLERLEAKLARIAGVEPEPAAVVLTEPEKEALVEEAAPVKPKRRRRKAAPKKEADYAAEERQEPRDDLGEHFDAS